MLVSTDYYKSKIIESRNKIFCDKNNLSPFQKIHSYTEAIDDILGSIYTATGCNAHDSCIIALGGYGRNELCPYSDIDILILHDGQKPSPEIESAVRSFWDIGLAMGCVVRTIDECIHILGQDIVTDCSFMECRLLTGSADLYNRLTGDVINPYFTKKASFFIREMRRILHNELYSPVTTLYHVEPDIKNGVCTLRDCHRLVWAEKMRVGLASINDLHSLSHFSVSQTKRFIADYEFLISVRIFLHCLCKRRMDILEIGLQPEIADSLGFGPNSAGILMEHYFKTVRDIRLFLLSFLEKSPAGNNLWGYFRKKVSAVEVVPGINVYEGIFFKSQKNIDKLIDPVWIMTVFRQSMRYQATLSVELRNKIRYYAGNLKPDDFKSGEVESLFREILSFDGPVSNVFQLMHETGVLSRIIPQFEDLTCKVEYDSYHEFTIDQHILMTLAEADKLTRDPDSGLRGLYINCKHKLLLRLSLLLHDIGKAMPGDHALNGAIIAEAVCERCGLDENDSRRIRLLVYHHLDMSNISFRREPESKVLSQFAAIIEDRKNLDLLYLLTILDIRSVGKATWTAWKAFQLELIYSSVAGLLDMPPALQAPCQSDAEDSGCKVYYLRNTLPEDRKLHENWLASLGPDEFQVHCDQLKGFERLTICGWDKTGFLRDVIGCISSEGYNILSAYIFSMPDNKALDIFYAEPPKFPAITKEQRIDNINNKWSLVVNKKATADSLVSRRIKQFPLKILRTAATQADPVVTIDNSSSGNTTIIEIKTPDNFGILHKIVQVFIKSGINIRSARLSTRADQAMDVFYVTNAENRKISVSILQELNANILNALKNTAFTNA
jgi:[protein-PII] uridylyltransferase